MYSRCTLLVVFKTVFQETLVSLEAYQLYPNQKISNGMIPHMKKQFGMIYQFQWVFWKLQSQNIWSMPGWGKVILGFILS